MIRTVLTFGLEPPKRFSGLKEKNWSSANATALKHLGATITPGDDWQVELMPDRIPELLKFFQGLRRDSQVTLFGMSEELTDTEKTPVEWFITDPESDGGGIEILWWDLQEPITESEDRLNIKADRMKPGHHLAGWTPLV